MSALSVLYEHGLTVQLIDGGRLYVTPRDRLTDDLRGFIREHKPEIVAALQPGDRWNPELAAEGYVWCLDCRYWAGGGVDHPDAGPGCTHPDNPYPDKQPLAPRYCQWYEDA